MMMRVRVRGYERGRLLMFAAIKDWHQTLSWKLGYGRGKEGRAYSCPWWVDEVVYALAYMQRKGVEITKEGAN
jgi:hypothetical protein